MEEIQEIKEICDLYLDPRILCAGQHVITSGSFSDLALHLSKIETVILNYDQLMEVLLELSRRFSACGANSGGNQAVLRSYKLSGFAYVAVAIENKKT
jgi:hypothetical protein